MNLCDSQEKIDSIVKKSTENILDAANKSIGLKTNQNTSGKKCPMVE